MVKSTSRALELIARHHKEYINTVKSLYGNNFEVANYAEDFVQEAYVKLSRYDNLYEKAIKPDGTVSKGYIFFCLRSVVLNKLTLKKVIRYNHDGDLFDVEDRFIRSAHEGLKGIEKITQGDRDPVDLTMDMLEIKMYNIVEQNSKWFDAKLFRTYLETGKSFRTLSDETGLGIQTIYLSIKRSKLMIADKLLEDYQDFANGDFNLN
jgi:DNA-directed RNA polymerase specialized sigma24 family protein